MKYGQNTEWYENRMPGASEHSRLLMIIAGSLALQIVNSTAVKWYIRAYLEVDVDEYTFEVLGKTKGIKRFFSIMSIHVL